MTEYEVMVHAKKYIDKMANGIDPLTDTPVKDGDLINNVRISRCLFFVSGVLEKVIANGGTAPRERKPREIKPIKQPFSITAEQLSAFPFSESPLPVTEIVRRINGLNDEQNVRPLSFRVITGWLTDHGFLESALNEFGKPCKKPTPEGAAIGITTVERSGVSGTYTATVYGLQAQHFIIDNFDAFLNRPAGEDPAN
ncbi:MAG: hypothetical protein IJU52_01985 [Clostridia bacterium]|nr:hypothetical protein [Clostridia bacterium]